MKNKILVVFGDPKSINSEIIFKSWKKIPKIIRQKIFVISNFNLLKSQLSELGYKIKLEKVSSYNLGIKTDNLKVINVEFNFENPFKFNEKKLKEYIHDSFNLAHNISIRDKTIIGIINCPIRKNLLGNKGYGVTEYLATKCLIKNNSEIMLIKSDNVSVSPLTTHTDIKNVSKKITKNFLVSKIKSINYNYKKIFSKKPKIAVLGLNPHNAEYRKNSEEIKSIIPAIKNLKTNNILAEGPFAADTIFIHDYKNFDVIVGMYHDQVLAPMKSLFKFNAINITLGLKYLRVSPDHGVSLNLIGKNKANPTSLIECIKFLNKFK